MVEFVAGVAVLDGRRSDFAASFCGLHRGRGWVTSGWQVGDGGVGDGSGI